MKSLIKVALAPAVLMVAACGGKGDDTLGDNVADAYEAQADNVEDMADNATTENAQDALENKADRLRETGERKEDAIDRSDVDTRGMSAAQKEAIANKM
ncbi:MAG: hypothetical protein ACKOXK_07160 [Chakrabartia sp.]